MPLHDEVHLYNFCEKYLLYSSVHHCQVLDFMLVNEFIFKKPDKFDFAFIEIFLFYSTIKRNVKKFAISVLSDTSSISGPGLSFTEHFSR